MDQQLQHQSNKNLMDRQLLPELSLFRDNQQSQSQLNAIGDNLLLQPQLNAFGDNMLNQVDYQFQFQSVGNELDQQLQMDEINGLLWTPDHSCDVFIPSVPNLGTASLASDLVLIWTKMTKTVVVQAGFLLLCGCLWSQYLRLLLLHLRALWYNRHLSECLASGG